MDILKDFCMGCGNKLKDDENSYAFCILYDSGEELMFQGHKECMHKLTNTFNEIVESKKRKTKN